MNKQGNYNIRLYNTKVFTSHLKQNTYISRKPDITPIELVNKYNDNNLLKLIVV